MGFVPNPLFHALCLAAKAAKHEECHLAFLPPQRAAYAAMCYFNTLALLTVLQLTYRSFAGRWLLESTAVSDEPARRDARLIVPPSYLFDATTTLDSSSGRIAHLPISPPGSLVGTRGIVYALPDLVGCQPVKRNKDYLTASYIRIALIIDDGNCPVHAKIAQAQYDGALGALVYNNTLDAVDMSTAMRVQMRKHRPKIPVMAVDRQYGEALQLEILTLVDEALHKSGNQFRAIFASLYPDDEREDLSAWEITLISLVVILAFGLSTSLLFHIISSRRRQAVSSHDNDRMNDLSKKIETLPACALDRLLLRTVSNSDVGILSEYTSPLDTILNKGGGHQSASSSFGTSSEDLHGQKDPCNDKGKQPDSMLKGCIATCIVCIDDFAVGSKMRILPCGHNYHIECIDPWLTSKSSLCPLCKYDTRDVLTDLERAYSGPRVIEDLSFRNSFSTSEPSSYLAESRARLQLVNVRRQIINLTHRIAAPVRAFTRKIKRPEPLSSNVASAGHEDIAMSSQQVLNRQLGCGVKAYGGTAGAGLVSIGHSINVDNDEKPEVVKSFRDCIRENPQANGKFIDRGCSPATTISSIDSTTEKLVSNQFERLKERRSGIDIYNTYDDDKDEDILEFDKHIFRLSLDSISDDGSPKVAN
ncbi:hypothetical protein H4S08_000801 [Coemansia sp. RSA 1365]|nr:hypothetical protein H4S08_000801 [Coemansia sp. RSA 1365]